MKVSNEECEALPLSAFEGRVVLVESAEQAEQAARELNAEALLGFDTETRPSFVRGNNYSTALLQLSTETTTWLVRLCRTGLPQCLADVMANPGIVKVGLAILDDLRGLQKLRPFTPGACLDLQRLARERGVEELGLKKMAAQVLGVRVSKRQRLTNWEADTLTPAQQTYAATDSWVSLLLYQAFMRGVVVHPRLAALRNNQTA